MTRIAITAITLFATLLGCATNKQTTFPTPDAAAQALVDAASSQDPTRIEEIFGPEGRDIIASGDDVADHERAQMLMHAYDEKHECRENSDGSVTLVIGKNDWPLPIPIVRDSSKSGWRFDTKAGREEILNRRIGANELAAIQVCLAIVDAQREYARTIPTRNGIPAYAQKFLSDAGARNGLYWVARDGEPQSPLGPMVASAADAGYTASHTEIDGPRAYHGYQYRILKAQGSAAPGGAHDYVVNGEMIGGFAVVAYPAAYGNSGVMTFMVNHQGTVYQRDLGSKTQAVAGRMNAFNPDSNWMPVETDDIADR